VIVGFSVAPSAREKYLYTSDSFRIAENINFYLVDASTVFIAPRANPICDVPILQNGGKPAEGGFLILSEEEKEKLLAAEPQAAPLLRPYMMGKDFIMRRPRYCLWMVGANPALLKQCPLVMKRIEQVRKYRLASPKVATQKKAETPTLFDEVRECKTDYVAIPKISSANRRYVPIEYLSMKVIPGDSIFMIPDSKMFHFGVLTSNVHMAWMRAVCGRMKSDYRYSNTVVYNNFPWPTPTDAAKGRDRVDGTGHFGRPRPLPGREPCRPLR